MAGRRVTIPNSVTSTGYEAFHDCRALSHVSFGSSVNFIDYEAFSGYNMLSEITAHPTFAPSLGTDVFSGVWSSIPVNVPCGSAASYYGNLYKFKKINDNKFFYTNFHELFTNSFVN